MGSADATVVGAKPNGVASMSVERTGDSEFRALLELAGAARPSAKTDIVFVLDVSSTTAAHVRSGKMAQTVWKVLEYVNQFDDDGVDFFRASALNEGGSGTEQLLKVLGAGKAPSEGVLAAAHGCVSEGQAATLEEVQRLLSVDGATVGLAGVLAPALRAAREKRKKTGRLFIQVVTDAQVVDAEAVEQEIVSMSRECEASSDKARYRLHVLGVGDVNREVLQRWDSGLGHVAPIDIVATDVADDLGGGAPQVFKEMRRSFMSISETALVEVYADGLQAVRTMGAAMSRDEVEKGKFVDSTEQLPPELVFDFSFKGQPVPVSLKVTMFREDGSEHVVDVVLPVPTA